MTVVDVLLWAFAVIVWAFVLADVMPDFTDTWIGRTWDLIRGGVARVPGIDRFERWINGRG